MAQMKITILGCGSSGGVPRIGGLWGDCDPNEPKNKRGRCSILVERVTEAGTTTVLVDTSPDLRTQLLDAEVARLDAVIYTHAHADHTHGIDDLRMVVINMRERLAVWADTPTKDALEARFGYVFKRPDGSMYPPILEMNEMDGNVQIDGPGGMLDFTPLLVNHGGMDALGFKMNNVVYMPDVVSIPEDVWPHLKGLTCWIIDALRRDPHPTHSHLEQTLGWIEDVAPVHAVLTNMHNDLDYHTLDAETPAHIEPAYDGMVLQFDLP